MGCGLMSSLSRVILTPVISLLKAILLSHSLKSYRDISIAGVS